MFGLCAGGVAVVVAVCRGGAGPTRATAVSVAAIAAALTPAKILGRMRRFSLRKATAAIAKTAATNPNARTGRLASAARSVMTQAGAHRRSATVHGPAKT